MPRTIYVEPSQTMAFKGRTNTELDTMATKDAPRPLTVSIVGAGIGGLAAAISLRRNGHYIQVSPA